MLYWLRTLEQTGGLPFAQTLPLGAVSLRSTRHMSQLRHFGVHQDKLDATV